MQTCRQAHSCRDRLQPGSNIKRTVEYGPGVGHSLIILISKGCVAHLQHTACTACTSCAAHTPCTRPWFAGSTRPADALHVKEANACQAAAPAAVTSATPRGASPACHTTQPATHPGAAKGVACDVAVGVLPGNLKGCQHCQRAAQGVACMQRGVGGQQGFQLTFYRKRE